MNHDTFQKDMKKKTFSRTFNEVLEDLEVNYLSNVFPVVDSIIMLPNVLIKINMIKGIEICKMFAVAHF